MKIALVTTPPSTRSGIGDYTRRLLPYLRQHASVELFVEHGKHSEPWEGERPRSIADLDPKQHDRILYQLGNELAHGFMVKPIRAFGGTVVQHDWVLFDLAMSAFPSMQVGNLRGHALVLREGGLEQERVYARNWLDRRAQRGKPAPEVDASKLAGVLLTGFHALEGRGRWTTDMAWLRLPARGCRRIRVSVVGAPGRSLEIVDSGHAIAQHAWQSDSRSVRLEAKLIGLDQPLIGLRTRGILVTPEQRAHGDSRRLGCFVDSVEWQDDNGWHELDLSLPCTHGPSSVSLSRDRFELALNRSVVRLADAFLVHSAYVKDKILRDRNQSTPVGIVHHGAERNWRDEDRREQRDRLGLPAAWREDFLLASFGGVQIHKRIDKLFEALALARRKRPGIRLLMIGGQHADGYDAPGHVRALGIADAVHFTGYVPERTGWDWLHASNLSVNLRGPTTGGTSGGVFQALSVGRAVVVSEAAEQRELPDSCCVKVPLGEGEVPAIAAAFVALHDDPARRARLEQGAREFVERECHWSLVARNYYEYLEGFPPARVVRKSLVALARARNAAG